jgi:dolichol-phosphate mannosyltransferase
MNPVVRWWRFNLVGVIGMCVQLGALAVLNRRMEGHYLIASAAALEITLLNNFAWHLIYTWRDRPDRSAIGSRLVRFHLTNGLVSLIGNLALMRLLVQGAHMPVLVANGIAILCCSILNFLLADRWAFAASSRIAAAIPRSNLVTLSAVPPPAPD